MKYSLDEFNNGQTPFSMYERLIKDNLAEKLIREDDMDDERISEVLDLPLDRVHRIRRQYWSEITGNLFMRTIPYLMLFALIGTVAWAILKRLSDSL